MTRYKHRVVPGAIVNGVVLALSVLTLMATPNASFVVAAFPPTGSVIRAKHSLQKHFDADRDGYLDRLEFSLLKTHLHFGFPLAKKIGERAYDFNHTLMLEPTEVSQRDQERRSGRYRQRLKEFREQLKKANQDGPQGPGDNVTKPGNRPLF